ncbi:MAG TPA: ATP-binding cassette domain-containing protein, partial [Candidatus Binatia bacterium]|nr:ATP-binding cassette domain-containing protein [Candidatus Binatia bacterium]
FTGYAGDILGIIGANGAGKTTLCRVLTGLLRPDAGAITVRGETSALLSLGTGFNLQLSGRENIFLNGMMLGLSKREMMNLLPKIVEFSGLSRFIDQPLKNYSSGMRARLAFSIAAMIEPEILILDETLSVGDLEFTTRAGEKMQAIIGKAKMVMVVTHQLDFVEQYCTKALWLYQGTVRASGPSREIVSLYRESIPKGGTPSKIIQQGGTASKIIELRKTSPRAGASAVVVVSNLGVNFSSLEAQQVSDRRARKLPAIWRRRKKPFWALQDISFAVNEGDIIGVIGPNGVGKTTLCRVLSGILKADKGQVSVAGKITALLTLGAGFNDQLTGRDNIYLNGMMLGMPKHRVQDVSADIVAFSGLAKFIEEPIKHYSQGMRSKLGFSIAAMLEPDIFIIDEALGAGDIAFYEKASDKIQELITRAKAVIIVTHSLAFVEQVCTRALWLNGGTVQFDGDPKEAVRRYRQSLQR